MLNRTAISVLAAIALLVGLQSSASAAPMGVVNGATQLSLTSFDTLTNGLGVTVTPGGTAQVINIPALPSPIVFYDVTSVDLDPASTQIFHVGSALDLTTTNTVSLSNFLIDATLGLVFADVVAPSLNGNAPIFTISKACSVANPCLGLDGTTTIDGLELQLSSAAGGLLASDLGIADLTGTVIAVANSSFTPVPEPSTALMALTGLVLLNVAGRRIAN